MNISLKKVGFDEKQILENLMEKHDYEFSQYDLREVNKFGLFGYMDLAHCWTDEGWFIYFIEVDGKLAGFVVVSKHFCTSDKERDFSMSDFFVTYKYRGTGVAKKAFFDALELHKGKWELYYHPKNIRSMKFWHKAISEYTDGKYEFIPAFEGFKYNDGTPADLFLFEIQSEVE